MRKKYTTISSQAAMFKKERQIKRKGFCRCERNMPSKKASDEAAPAGARKAFFEQAKLLTLRAISYVIRKY